MPSIPTQEKPPPCLGEFLPVLNIAPICQPAGTAIETGDGLTSPCSVMFSVLDCAANVSLGKSTSFPRCSIGIGFTFFAREPRS
jgi:hypothetical protein